MHSENLQKGEKVGSGESFASEVCKQRVGPFNITCNGKMEYHEDEMMLICEDCGNTRELL